MLRFRVMSLLLLALGGIFVNTLVLAADVELIGTFSFPGQATDRSAISGKFPDGTPQNQLGGFSAITYDKQRNRYLVLPDRGPNDGARPYACRFHELELAVSPGATPAVSAKLLASHPLVDEQGQSFVGLSAAINAQHPELSLRFDPEGIRVASNGLIYISDEYGPHVFAFNQRGQLQTRLAIPAHLQVLHPHADEDQEIADNATGRMTNKGFEGLALSPDGRRLYAMLQGPLLQDHAQDAHGERVGLHTRLVEFDLKTKRTREMVYVLDKPKHGLSEILMVDEHRILVLERDSKPGDESQCKTIYLADFSQASDVSQVKSLPAARLPDSIRPITKRLFLDLLDERHGLTRSEIPAKLEGLAFGPDLPDGRKLLIVCSDNDFKSSEPSWIYAFAVQGESLRSASTTDGPPNGLGLTSEARLATGPVPVADGLEFQDHFTIRGPRNLYKGYPPRNANGTVNVIVEIPTGTNAKWEVTSEGVLDWEIRDGQPRIVNYLPYPGNYGMIPGTLLPKELGGDGDALDVLVLGPALPRGTVAQVHLIGVMKYLDKGEQDDKILAVMENTPLGKIRSLKELNDSYPGVSEIVHLWFSNYKGLQKKMIFKGWGDVDVVEEILERATAHAKK